MTQPVPEQGVFQIERVVREEPLLVAGRVLEGELASGALLELAAAGPDAPAADPRPRFRVERVDAYGRAIPRAPAGMVAGLYLTPLLGEGQSRASAVDSLTRGRRLIAAAAEAGVTRSTSPGP